MAVFNLSRIPIDKAVSSSTFLNYPILQRRYHHWITLWVISIVSFMLIGCDEKGQTKTTTEDENTATFSQPVCNFLEEGCNCFDGDQMESAPSEFCTVPANDLVIKSVQLDFPDGDEGSINEIVLSPELAGNAPAPPDFSRSGTFGTRMDPAWSKFIINGRDLGWYGSRTNPVCAVDMYISVNAGDNVATCNGVNFKPFCDTAKANAVAKAQALPCPSQCPNKTPIWDQFAKWNCGPAGAGTRAWCHWQVGFQCFTI